MVRENVNIQKGCKNNKKNTSIGQFSKAAISIPSAQSFVSAVQTTQQTWVTQNSLKEGV